MNVVKVHARTFFDRKAVVDAVGKANAAVLAKSGAFVRRKAKSLIRKRKRASRPGEPPSSHVGTLKNLIFFSFDVSTKSVVIGPTPFRGPAVAPRMLELGGLLPTQINRRRKKRVVGGAGEIRVAGSISRVSLGKLSTKTAKLAKNTLLGNVRVAYAPLETQAQADRANDLNAELYGPEMLPQSRLERRPYMGPALAEELPKLPPLFANAVR